MKRRIAPGPQILLSAHQEKQPARPNYRNLARATLQLNPTGGPAVSRGCCARAEHLPLPCGPQWLGLRFPLSRFVAPDVDFRAQIGRAHV